MVVVTTIIMVGTCKLKADNFPPGNGTRRRGVFSRIIILRKVSRTIVTLDKKLGLLGILGIGAGGMAN